MKNRNNDYPKFHFQINQTFARKNFKMKICIDERKKKNVSAKLLLLLLSLQSDRQDFSRS